MTEIQYIPKDWDKKVEAHIDTMKAANKSALAQSPGPEYERLWDIYESTCRDFLTHLTDHYGSPDAFASYLREDLSGKLIAVGLSEDVLGEEDNWKTSLGEDWLDANKAASVYENMYVPLVESIAHKVAFHHATPSFDL